ncbi:hypothetical protein EDB19DRAFT_1737400 [Suillus lakei]|nr:hypothetical protein EDB19DRAFT_1737400 [Suillus lakei]
MLLEAIHTFGLLSPFSITIVLVLKRKTPMACPYGKVSFSTMLSLSTYTTIFPLPLGSWVFVDGKIEKNRKLWIYAVVL